MLNILRLPSDFCIGNYISRDRYSNDHFPYDPYTGFVLDIKTSQKESIQEAVALLAECFTGFDSVAVVPSHCSDKAVITGIRRVAGELARKTKTINATACLRRYKTIQKRTHEGSDRAESEHLESIELHNNDLIQGKRVLLIDDVRTTGNSLKVCQQILQQAAPKSVHSLALAQSAGLSGCDPEINYQNIDIEIQYEYQQQVEVHQVPHAEDENAVTLYLRRIEKIEVYADMERQALDRLRAFAGLA